MKGSIYIISDGQTTLGFITQEEFDKMKSENKIEFYMDDPNLPMYFDESKDHYLSLSKAYKICLE